MPQFNSGLADAQRIRLVSEQTGRIKDLQGFRKNHKAPSEFTEQTRAFVSRIADADIQNDLDEQFRAFRRHLGFRRAEMTVDEPVSGTARIVTPWFDYAITVEQHPDDHQQARSRRVVSEFRRPDKIATAEFSLVFGSSFRTVELDLLTPLPLEEFIDRVEDQQESTVTIDYDRHATWCVIGIENVPGQLHVTADCVSLTALKPVSPDVLLKSFFIFCDRFPGIEVE